MDVSVRRIRPGRGNPCGCPRLAISTAQPQARQILARANRLFDQGKFAEAAPIFERLAKGAAERGMLNRAGDLYLQSATCPGFATRCVGTALGT